MVNSENRFGLAFYWHCVWVCVDDVAAIGLNMQLYVVEVAVITKQFVCMFSFSIRLIYNVLCNKV